MACIPDGMSFAANTVSVNTRHSPECSKRDGRNWKRCNCRKWLYVYVSGEGSRISAGSLPWEQAERVAQAERDRRDPGKKKLQEIKEHGTQKAIAQWPKNITVTDVTDRWIAAQKIASQETAAISGRAAKEYRHGPLPGELRTSRI